MIPPYVFGPLVWPLGTDMIRAFYVAWGDANVSAKQTVDQHDGGDTKAQSPFQMSTVLIPRAVDSKKIHHTEQKPITVDVLTFFYALRRLVGCAYCRASFSEFLSEDPPERHLDDLHAWWNSVHNSVNAKTHQRPFPLAWMRNKLEVYSEFVSMNQVWDLIFLFAAHMPDADDTTPFGVAYRPALFVWLNSLSHLVPHLKHLAQLAPFLLSRPALVDFNKPRVLDWAVTQRTKHSTENNSIVSYTLEEATQRFIGQPLFSVPKKE